MPEVKATVLKLLEPYPVRVYLIGSFARGDFRTSSDVDIVVIDSEILPPGKLAEVRECLDESNIPFRIDVVDWREVGEDFHRNVTKEGILWKGC